MVFYSLFNINSKINACTCLFLFQEGQNKTKRSSTKEKGKQLSALSQTELFCSARCSLLISLGFSQHRISSRSLVSLLPARGVGFSAQEGQCWVPWVQPHENWVGNWTIGVVLKMLPGSPKWNYLRKWWKCRCPGPVPDTESTFLKGLLGICIC